MDVFINYHANTAAAENTASAVAERGGRPHLVRADDGTIEGARAPVAAVAAVAAVTGQLDQLVHCAVDTSASGPILQRDPAAIARASQCNGAALLPLVQTALPLFRRGSSVVFATSRGSQSVVAGYGAVGVPKAMAEALVNYLAVGLGVRANSVAAAALDTDALCSVLPAEEVGRRLARAADLNPSGRRVEISELVDAIEFLCSPRAVMIQGQRINVDGGFYVR